MHPWSALFGNTLLLARARAHVRRGATSSSASCSPASTRGAAAQGRWGRYERTALAIPLTIAALAAPAQLLVGDWAAREVATQQPVKLAAFEGLQQTTTGAPMHLGRLVRAGPARSRAGSRSPTLLSLLAYHDPNATVRGLDVGAAGRPPGRSTSSASRSRRWSGSARCWRRSASFVLCVRWRRRRLPESRWFYRARGRCRAALGRRADRGWVATEVGRQPWVVYGVMRTERGGHGRRRDPGRLRDAGASSTWAGRRRWVDPAPARARAARRRADPQPTGAAAGERREPRRVAAAARRSSA